MRASAERGNLNSVGGLGAIEANLSQGWKLKKAECCNMSTTPDEKKEAAVEGDLTWSGARPRGI